MFERFRWDLERTPGGCLNQLKSLERKSLPLKVGRATRSLASSWMDKSMRQLFWGNLRWLASELACMMDPSCVDEREPECEVHGEPKTHWDAHSCIAPAGPRWWLDKGHSSRSSTNAECGFPSNSEGCFRIPGHYSSIDWSWPSDAYSPRLALSTVSFEHFEPTIGIFRGKFAVSGRVSSCI